MNPKIEKIKMTTYTMDEYLNKLMIDDVSYYIKSKYKITIEDFCKIANKRIGTIIDKENS